MQAHDRAHDGQAQSSAALCAAAAAVDAVKPVEQMGRCCASMPAPGLLTSRETCVAPCSISSDTVCPAGQWRRALDSRFEIARWIISRSPTYPGTANDRQLNLLVLCGQGKQVGDFQGFIFQRNQLERRQRRRVADLRQKQHVRDNPRKAIQFFGTRH